MTDGGFLCLELPDKWQRISELIQQRLRNDGVLTARVYLSTGSAPERTYDNPNLMRFVPSMADVDANSMVQVNTHPDYAAFDVRYAFPTREIVLKTFGALALKDELVPSYEEGDRFVTFALQKNVDS